VFEEFCIRAFLDRYSRTLSCSCSSKRGLGVREAEAAVWAAEDAEPEGEAEATAWVAKAAEPDKEAEADVWKTPEKK
jgi:hypothetical protein